MRVGGTDSFGDCCLVSGMTVGSLGMTAGHKGLLQEVSELFETEIESDVDTSEDLPFVEDFSQ